MNDVSLADTKYEKPIYRKSTKAGIDHFGYKTERRPNSVGSSSTPSPIRINILKHREVLCKLLNGLQQDNGATVSKQGQVVTRGYSVSIMPHLEHTFPDSDTLIHPALQVSNWLNRLPELTSDQCYGIWRDSTTDQIYLDISIVFNHPEAALSLAKWYKQKAIFDIHNQEAIWLTQDKTTSTRK